VLKLLDNRIGSVKALFFSFTSSVFKTLGNLVVLLVIVNRCQLDLVGQFGYLIVLMNLINMFIDFGFAQSAIKYMTTLESAIRFTNAMCWTKLLLVCPLIVIYLLGLIGKTEFLFFFSSFFFSWGGDLFIRKRLLFEFFAEAILNVIYTIILVFSVVLLDEVYLFDLAKIYFFCRLMYLVLSLYVNAATVKILLPNMEDMAVMLKMSWPFFMQIFVASLIVSVDTVIVKYFDNMAAVGSYQFISKLLVISSVLVAAIQNYKFAHYVRLHDKKDLKLETLHKDSKDFLFLGLLLCGVVYIFSKIFAEISLDRLYFTSTIYVVLFTIIIGRNIILPYGVYLSISGLQKSKLLYNVLGLLTQLVVSISLYKYLGMTVVLLGMLMGYIVTYTFYYYRTLKSIYVA
jgi:O-antigen/teichoic acid export membrane protein